jgi:glycosyltransferase involved in cell wall biosynthesis
LGTRSDVPELLGLADTLVLSSKMEANPVSILEGLACGKPVVAPRVGSIPETVHHGENGFLVDPNDPEQLADGIEKLLTDPALARRMGKIGRNSVVADWSLERMVNGYQNLIHSTYLNKLGFSRINQADKTPTSEGSLTSEEPVELVGR